MRSELEPTLSKMAELAHKITITNREFMAASTDAQIEVESLLKSVSKGIEHHIGESLRETTQQF